ncbi:MULTISPECIES: BLUF domain-containing protein [Paracoccus]|uniref:BLUF domain-containing protein n=1 Tax=Paracoccus TaxID=265 RepID=UPI000FDB1339|nr:MULTISPECIES: BLUF domain-containing protein [Paracoccus]AZY93446.1 BLUF domain-containing protein [Paracoccus sp. Arc7-R13]TNB96954.1 BLUF domain-containing protein [Paracoccus marcusii]
MTSDLDDLQGLGFVLYRSTARAGLDGSTMQDILRTARHRNQSLGLTGCLHHEDGLFFQWLEGPADGLRKVVASLMDDDRHRDFEILDQGALDHRRFQDWRMRFSDRDRASLMDWFARSDSSTVHRGDYAGGVVAFMMGLDL